jgi:hypothetical protein
MATSLQIGEALSATAQPVTDQDGNASPLLLANDRVGVGIGSGSVMSVRQVPAPKRSHLQIGDPTATPGQASAKLSFAGSGIEHAGFAWVPDGQLSNGKLHLTFGGSDDPTPRNPQPARVTFKADGKVGIGTSDPTEVLEVNGNILATGDVRLAGADCAEAFDVAELTTLEPGTVMVIGDEERLYRCTESYDRRVAGVVSGAGDCRPGILLGQEASPGHRLPLALTGKVYCKVDASFAPIDVGDLLTTSPNPGHAMKACDASRAFGAVLGKALRPLAEGIGLVPILVALQ